MIQEEGLLAETEAIAVKRVIAYQIEKETAERHVSKSALARMMRTGRPASRADSQPRRVQRTVGDRYRGGFHQSTSASRFSPDTGAHFEGASQTELGQDQPDPDTCRGAYWQASWKGQC